MVQVQSVKDGAPVQALEGGKQVQDLEDVAPVQALEDGEQVQNLEDRNHLDQGALLLAAVAVPGGQLILFGQLGALLVLVVLDGKQVQDLVLGHKRVNLKLGVAADLEQDNDKAEGLEHQAYHERDGHAGHSACVALGNGFATGDGRVLGLCGRDTGPPCSASRRSPWPRTAPSFPRLSIALLHLLCGGPGQGQRQHAICVLLLLAIFGTG